MEAITNAFKKVKEQSPLVQSITNYVVMNNTANALLSLGASPIMAHARSEMEDMVSIISALVVNIGTLDEYWVESMLAAAKKAKSMEKPFVLDPVGAGATPYRNQTLTQLIQIGPSIIRGNASEIMSLASVNIQSKGVDSSNTSDEALDAGKRLSNETGAVVCISGEVDYVILRDKVGKIKNGNPMMAKVTGMGCTASAIVGAFAAVEKDLFTATMAAMAVMGVAGDLAAEKAEGPGTLQLHFYDALYQLNPEQLAEKAIVEFQ
ncbi:Hydroxyethylthiazole kinase [Indibacter alkaliphilus LW1]|uniref:Hydroxyethylthiazole kinase n=1 Tax=Indibacter alkaliphilus (strain CCUG 57479 / KCTC 22604 / LW1) TaxID=1189612 RepID=S2D7J4_INDAL|nr:hydroxyethylthiazole kinase [Indibacter alkaliphilus]EOZ95187.1 Hydroxyethylthiazole kinase [Indibacter alkaliphilus LW1]